MFAPIPDSVLAKLKVADLRSIIAENAQLPKVVIDKMDKQDCLDMIQSITNASTVSKSRTKGQVKQYTAKEIEGFKKLFDTALAGCKKFNTSNTSNTKNRSMEWRFIERWSENKGRYYYVLELADTRSRKAGGSGRVGFFNHGLLEAIGLDDSRVERVARQVETLNKFTEDLYTQDKELALSLNPRPVSAK